MKEADGLALERKDKGRPQRDHNSLGVFGKTGTVRVNSFDGCGAAVQSI